ncbi:MAG: sugar phosphate nucleotidyltransferase [Defluviitaleaceae bacterium]|nr:sugar phosphate nucleotidyltransferase [Defluviitaleaceae bacterium]
MTIVLLSGGSGKRLWPLSNDMLSKQFLKLLHNERGESESMVQRVARQIGEAHKNVNLFVSCNFAQNDILKKQLGNVETILEPARRDTFPAICLAAAYLHYEQKLDEQATFVVCPIDVFAQEKYFQLLADTDALVSQTGYNIGLMGTVPTYPSSKYGYIRYETTKVLGFVEKPTEKAAEKLITEGALWNCGVFALKIGYILDCARKYADFDGYETLYKNYEKLPKISFDYEVVEKAPSVGVVTYDGVWKDLGTWNTLTDEISQQTIGNVLISETCENTHVINTLNIPVIVQGIADSVVIASYDGILVSNKYETSFLKPLADQISMRPMYQQESWGDYRILDYKPEKTASSLIRRIRIDAGKELKSQFHLNRNEVWVVLTGKGILTLNGTDSVVAAGSVVQVPQKAKHSLIAATAMELIEIQLGSGELEEDGYLRQPL